MIKALAVAQGAVSHPSLNPWRLAGRLHWDARPLSLPPGLHACTMLTSLTAASLPSPRPAAVLPPVRVPAGPVPEAGGLLRRELTQNAPPRLLGCMLPPLRPPPARPPHNGSAYAPLPAPPFRFPPADHLAVLRPPDQGVCACLPPSLHAPPPPFMRRCRRAFRRRARPPLGRMHPQNLPLFSTPFLPPRAPTALCTSPPTSAPAPPPAPPPPPRRSRSTPPGGALN